MDVSFSPGAQEVLHDLLHERGLTDWRVVHDVRISETSGSAVDIIYGHVLVSSLQEDRIDRKRKRKRKLPAQAETPVVCCFLVLPATSARAPVLSIQQLLALQQCATTNAVAADASQRTFLCLTDASNISYYQLQSPASLP